MFELFRCIFIMISTVQVFCNLRFWNSYCFCFILTFCAGDLWFCWCLLWFSRGWLEASLIRPLWLSFIHKLSQCSYSSSWTTLLSLVLVLFLLSSLETLGSWLCFVLVACKAYFTSFTTMFISYYLIHRCIFAYSFF